MGTTNLLIGLKRKFAHLSGEARALDGRIQHLKAECAGLKELRAQAASLRTGIGHVSAVIKMIEPTWDEVSVAAIKPHTRRNPMKPGECISTAMDILRTADRWLTSRELGKAVLHHFGLPTPEPELLRRVTNSIDAALGSSPGRVAFGLRVPSRTVGSAYQDKRNGSGKDERHLTLCD